MNEYILRRNGRTCIINCGYLDILFLQELSIEVTYLKHEGDTNPYSNAIPILCLSHT